MISIAPLSELFALVQRYGGRTGDRSCGRENGDGYARRSAPRSAPGRICPTLSPKRNLSRCADSSRMRPTTRGSPDLQEGPARVSPTSAIALVRSGRSIDSESSAESQAAVLVVMDEVGACRLPALTPTEPPHMSRKQGGANNPGPAGHRTVAATLGVYGAQSISGSCLTRLMLRGVEYATAEWRTVAWGTGSERGRPNPFHESHDFARRM